MNKYIIIGDGVAGDTAAATIRENDFEGIIDVFTKESVPFYYRPRLIDYLAKNVEFKKIILHSEEWYKSNNINLHLKTEIVSVNPGDSEVLASDGTKYEYDRLLIAAGANCFRPFVKGLNEKNVFTLKNKEDTDTILLTCENKTSAIVIGGGLLGLETANSLKSSGLNVKVIEFFQYLLPRQLDRVGAGILQKRLISLGLDFFLGEESSEIIESDGKLNIILKSGSILEGDLVIVSAGVRPELKLAGTAGINVNKGIIVNDYMETNIKGIYAAGDVIEHNGKLYGIWQPAKEQGETAGVNMSGKSKEYKGTLASHKLKVVGVDLLSAGNIDPDEKAQSCIFIDESALIYKKAVIENNIITGCIMLGDVTGDNKIMKAIKERSLFDSVREFFV